MSGKIFDIVSPSYTGLGLEVLRTAPLIRAALRTGQRPRLWTFHPGAFDGRQYDVVPLQQGWEPLLPISEKHSCSNGVVWLPHTHRRGPYVCKRSLAEALACGWKGLDDKTMPIEPGAYPTFVREIAEQMFGDDGAPGMDIDPLYPADVGVEATSIVLNLVGAHGKEKGLTDASAVCAVVNRLADVFLLHSCLVLLHARVCAGQRAVLSGRNIRALIHLDSDALVARCIGRNTKVITVEGGLAHFAIHRGISPVVVGLPSWLNKTSYLYPAEQKFTRCTVDSLDVNALVGAIENQLQKWF